MEKLQFDTGMKAYRLGDGGVLRFHPGDPNLYSRFLEAVDKFKALEQEMANTALEEDGQLLQAMRSADKKMKEVLNWVFGAGNDFDEILGGVNLLAVAENGERIITNLLLALEPVLLEGAKGCAAAKTQAAQEKANKRRAAQ